MKRHSTELAGKLYGPSAGEVSSQLAQQAEAVAEYLLPNGKRMANSWVCGNVDGDAGESLKVTLTGDMAGKWKDYATDEYGDLLDLWGATRYCSPPVAFSEARDYLGQPIGKRPSPQKNSTAIRPVKQTEELKTVWTWRYPEKDGISGKAVRKENAAGEKCVFPYFLRDNPDKCGIEAGFIPPLYGKPNEQYVFVAEG